jgi:hypothetical protein
LRAVRRPSSARLARKRAVLLCASKTAESEDIHRENSCEFSSFETRSFAPRAAAGQFDIAPRPPATSAVHGRGQAGLEPGGRACKTNIDGQGTHRRLGNSPRGVASRAASKASLSAASDNANLIAGALAMRAIAGLESSALTDRRRNPRSPLGASRRPNRTGR